MLGGRGGAHPQDGAPHGGDHGRDPDPDRGLRLPRGGGPGPGGAAAARAGAVRVLGRGPPDGRAGPRRPARCPGRPGRDPRPARQRRAARARGQEGRDMIRRYLGFLMLRALARLIWRLLRIAVLVAALILAAPAVLVAAYAAALAWFLGWPPRPLYPAAAWCLPMLAAWLAAMAAGGRRWPQLAAAPYLAWLATWHEAAAGSYLKAAVTIAPLAIPLGLLAGALAWSWRIYTMETGSGGGAPNAPAAFCPGARAQPGRNPPG